MAKKSKIVKYAKPAKFKTRQRNACRRCGFPRSYYRKFGLCKNCIRDAAYKGQIPGMTKSSW